MLPRELGWSIHCTLPNVRVTLSLCPLGQIVLLRFSLGQLKCGRRRPFDTKFDTAGCFQVLNGITRQHGARASPERLWRETTRNHEISNSDKSIVNTSEN